MMKMNKKGQAALEFLMTYGWAIMAAIIGIGVIMSMGIFNPAPQNTGIVNEPFRLEAYQLLNNNPGYSNHDTISLELTNNAGVDITNVIVTMTLTNPPGGHCGPTTGISLSQGDTQIIIADCGELGNAKTTIKGNIAINYTKSGQSLTSTGSINALLL
jgi:hypothetical protein